MTETLQPAIKQTAFAVAAELRRRLPLVLAVYLFGSRVSGQQTPDSDWDIAVWVEGKLEPLQIWETAHTLANICGSDVDLVDLRTASTVMQYQVIAHGVKVWQRSGEVEILEAMVLSEKTTLDEARRLLMERIRAEGKVYG